MEVAKLNVAIGAKIDGLEKGLATANKKIDKFGGNVERSSKKIDGLTGSVANFAKGAIGAFGAIEIFKFTSRFIGDSIEIAARAEGIEAAFGKLNRPGLLGNLRKATSGTVSDLNLMQKAVQANNFKIPLGQLAKFFEFATKRAAQTGESVDFLVNSIVAGIGRKSSLVLDNLGISASELQSELQKTGDFGLAAGNIIQRELGKAGDVALTTAQRTAQLNAEIENQQKLLGEKLTPAYRLFLANVNSSLDGVTRFFQGLKNLATGTTVPDFLETQRLAKDRKIYETQLEKMRAALKATGAEGKKQAETLGSLNAQLKLQQDNLLKIDIADEAALKTQLAVIESTKERIETLRNLNNVLARPQAVAPLEGGGPQTLPGVATPVGLENVFSNDLLARQNAFRNVNNQLSQELQLASANLLAYGSAFDFTTARNDALAEAITGLIENGFDPQGEKVQELVGQMTDLQNVTDELSESQLRLADGFTTGFDSIIGSIASGQNALTAFGNAALNVARQFIQAKFQEALASAIASSFTTGLGPLAGIALAGVALAGVKSLFNKIPAMADGGIVTGPTLALIGESGPEAVVPLNQFNSQMGEIRVIVEGNLKGQDIFLSGENFKSQQNRMT